MALLGTSKYGEQIYASSQAGIRTFQSGIGHSDDLLVTVNKQPDNRWTPEIHSGHYYFDSSEHYLYANPVNVTIPSIPTHSLGSTSLSGYSNFTASYGPVELSGPLVYNQSNPSVVDSYGSLCHRVYGNLRAGRYHSGLDNETLSGVTWNSYDRYILTSYDANGTPVWELKTFQAAKIAGDVISVQSPTLELHPVDSLLNLNYDDEYYLEFKANSDIDPPSGVLNTISYDIGQSYWGAGVPDTPFQLSYRISALDTSNSESFPSLPLIVTVTQPGQVNTISWPAIQGANNYAVYRGSYPGQEILLGYTNGVPSYVDKNNTAVSPSVSFVKYPNTFILWIKRDSIPHDISVNYLEFLPSLQQEEILKVSSDGKIRVGYSPILFTNSATSLSPVIRRFTIDGPSDSVICSGNGSVGTVVNIKDTAGNDVIVSGNPVTKTIDLSTITPAESIPSGEIVAVRYYVDNSFMVRQETSGSQYNTLYYVVSASGDYNLTWEPEDIEFYDSSTITDDTDPSYVQLNPLKSGVGSGFLYITQATQAINPSRVDLNVYPTRILRGGIPNGVVYWYDSTDHDGDSNPDGGVDTSGNPTGYRWARDWSSVSTSSFWHEPCRIMIQIFSPEGDVVRNATVSVTASGVGKLKLTTESDTDANVAYTRSIVTDWQGKAYLEVVPSSYGNITITATCNGISSTTTVNVVNMLTTSSTNDRISSIESNGQISISISDTQDSNGFYTLSAQALRADGIPKLGENLTIKFSSQLGILKTISNSIVSTNNSELSIQVNPSTGIARCLYYPNQGDIIQAKAYSGSTLISISRRLSF